MRLPIAIFLTAALVTEVGCDSLTPRPAAARPDLKFRIAWPGTPKEMWPDDTSGAWIYMANYPDKERQVLYSVMVSEMGPEATNTLPKDLLAKYRHNLPRKELSITESEYGPRKLPAAEIVATEGTRTKRELAVGSGTRIYVVSVSSPKKEDVEGLDATTFLHSLVVDE